MLEPLDGGLEALLYGSHSWLAETFAEVERVVTLVEVASWRWVTPPPPFPEGNPVMGIAFLLMGLSDVPFMHLMTFGPQVVALLHGPQVHQLFLDFLLSVPSKR